MNACYVDSFNSVYAAHLNVCAHILDVVEAQRGAFSRVLQWLSTESLVMTMEEAVDYKFIRLKREA